MITITKTLPCIRVQGSLTAEAALVMPFVVLFLTLFLGLFRVEQVEMQVNQALSYTAQELAIQTDEAMLLPFGAQSLFIKELKEQGLKADDIQDGWKGFRLSLTESDVQTIRLRVDYQIQLPINVFGKKSVGVTQSAMARRWTGQSADVIQRNQWVYVTPYGTAYHITSNCRYLDLSVWATTQAQITTLRNQDGKKYAPCKACITAQEDESRSVYVTDYGEVYHTTLSCVGLKRTVYRISRELASGRSPCQKCYGGTQ